MKHVMDNNELIFHLIVYISTIMILPVVSKNKQLLTKTKICFSVILISLNLFIIIYFNGLDKVTYNYFIILLIVVLYILYERYKNKA
ncbi:Uncharacterised protein [[Clostridium] sordellii]|uniref:Uncharacterized protein n=1 Tax=Paraclostridium sordellii TaxID=1505 RepID=A0ABP1Y192_PARSO|nr:hypothetical protein [Paeniclostridium sordellii]TAN66155.1 hypothetical protein WS9_011060 [Paeniclostridium sordellii 8483]CEJ75510.1 hypothetical protein ATCC9714PCS11_00511 (plasmid) [[Clostridium] sordellii] [Paeniclostridium sordellii]CEN22467.1 Uncharacterised protein [[Clostridium] sordellii] [Paeniclostridium sordellii]CEN29728.1 Uncharacterised protein [[Clostridium] sordellii] [Paeniclostridium sordellii]